MTTCVPHVPQPSHQLHVRAAGDVRVGAPPAVRVRASVLILVLPHGAAASPRRARRGALPPQVRQAVCRVLQEGPVPHHSGRHLNAVCAPPRLDPAPLACEWSAWPRPPPTGNHAHDDSSAHKRTRPHACFFVRLWIYTTSDTTVGGGSWSAVFALSAQVSSARSRPLFPPFKKR